VPGVSVSGDWMQARSRDLPRRRWSTGAALAQPRVEKFLRPESSNEEPPSAVAASSGCAQSAGAPSTILGASGSSCTPSRRKSVSALVSLPKVSCARLRKQRDSLFLRFACAFAFNPGSAASRRRTVPSEAPRPHRGCRGSGASSSLRLPSPRLICALGIDGVIVRDRGDRNEDVGCFRSRITALCMSRAVVRQRAPRPPELRAPLRRTRTSPPRRPLPPLR